MSKVSKFISYIMFWIENMIYVVLFLIFEILICPFAYFKVWYNFILLVRTTGSGTISIMKSLIYSTIWAFTGPITMIYIIGLDIMNFLHILKFHDGFIQTKDDKIAAKKTDETNKIKLYNEARAIVISLFKKIVKFIAKENELGILSDDVLIEDSSEEDVLEKLPDFFTFED